MSDDAKVYDSDTAAYKEGFQGKHDLFIVKRSDKKEGDRYLSFVMADANYATSTKHANNMGRVVAVYRNVHGAKALEISGEMDAYQNKISRHYQHIQPPESLDKLLEAVDSAILNGKH